MIQSATDETSPDSPVGTSVRWHADERKNTALNAYLECGTVAGAARAADVARQTIYGWIESDRGFADAIVACRRELADDLEEEAFRRAKEGSDDLLKFLLRAHRPERYREKQTIEVVSPDVQNRLAQQADAILEVCRRELPREQANIVASGIANRLRAVWQ